MSQLMLESPETIETRNKKSIDRTIKSVYDLRLSCISSAGGKNPVCLTEKPKPEKSSILRRIRKPATPPASTNKTEMRMPEPEHPKVLYSKPEPEPWSQMMIEIESPFQFILRKISEFLFGSFSLDDSDSKSNKKSHIYV